MELHRLALEQEQEEDPTLEKEKGDRQQAGRKSRTKKQEEMR